MIIVIMYMLISIYQLQLKVTADRDITTWSCCWRNVRGR